MRGFLFAIVVLVRCSPPVGVSAYAAHADALLDGAAGATGSIGPSGTNASLPGCSSGDTLRWDGAQWVCSLDSVATSSADITDVQTPSTGGLSGGASSGVVTLRLKDCGANEVLHWGGSGWVCGADRDVPVPPVVSAGQLSVTNTNATSAATAIAVTTTNPAAVAIAGAHAGTGPAARLTGDSLVNRGELLVRDRGNTQSGLTLQTANGSSRFDVAATFGGGGALTVSNNGGGASLSVQTSDRVDVDRIGFAMSNVVFNGTAPNTGVNNHGGFVIGVNGALGNTPTCSSVCTAYGFVNCLGTWIVGGAAGTGCATTVANGQHAMCFCSY